MCIEPAQVAGFAQVLGVPAEAGVPPTFAAVYALGATAPQLFQDPEAAIDMGRLVHAGQAFTWRRHPEVGERLAAHGRVVSDVERRGIRMIEFETTCSAGDEPICTSLALFVIRP